MIKGIKNYFSFFGMMVATVNATLAKYASRFISSYLFATQLLAKLALVCELSPQIQNSKIHRRTYDK
jgi:hypothetical protein